VNYSNNVYKLRALKSMLLSWLKQSKLHSNFPLH